MEVTKGTTKVTTKVTLTTDTILGVMAAILFIVVIVFPFTKSGYDMAAVELVLGGLLLGLLLLSNKKLKEIQFGKLKAILAEAREATQEAREVTKEVKEFMKTTSIAVLGLVKGTGRSGVYGYEEKEQIRQDIVAKLAELEISQEEIEDIEKKSKWHDYTAVDYVYHILQGSHFPSEDAFTRGTELSEAEEL